MAILSSDGSLELVDISFSSKKMVYGEETPFSITLKNVSKSAIKDFSAYITLCFPANSDIYSNGITKQVVLYGTPKDDGYSFQCDSATISWNRNTTKTFTGTFKFVSYDFLTPNTSVRELVYNSVAYNGLTISFYGNYKSNTSYAISGKFMNLEKAGGIYFLNSYYKPVISSFSVVRSTNGKEDDEGVQVLANIKLALADRTYYDRLSLKFRYRKSESGDAYTEVDISQIIGSALDTELTTVIKDINDIAVILDKNTDWDLELWFGDSYESWANNGFLSRSFANVHLSGASTGGVCFGSFSKAKENEPLFQCYYPAEFEAGIKGGFTYTAGEVLTGGKWIDGNDIYRYVLVTESSLDGAGGVIGNLPSKIDYLVSAHGTLKSSDGNVRPVPYSYYGSLGWSATFYVDGNGAVNLQLGNSYSGTHTIAIILEYTKPKEASA